MRLSKKEIAVICVAFILLAGVKTGLWQIPGAPLQLHVQGNLLVDALGQPVLLRGAVKGVCTNVYPGGNWPVQGGGPDSGWNTWNIDNVRWHFQQMRALGFTVWRCFGWNLYMWVFRASDANSQLAVDRMLEAIRVAGEEGLYVEVAPYAVSNQRAIEGEDLETLPFPPYIGSTDGQAAITSEQDFIDVWVDIASTFESLGYHHVLFELYNEPNWPLWGGHDRVQSMNDYFRVMQDTIDAMRVVTDLPIVVQWRPSVWYNEFDPSNSADLQWVWDYNLTGGNIVISAHTYRTYGGWNSPVARTYDEVRFVFEYLFHDVHLSYPVFIGEFGIDNTLSGTAMTEELEAHDNLLTLFNEWNIHYTYFNWASQGMFPFFENSAWLPPLTQGGGLVASYTGSYIPPPPTGYDITVTTQPAYGVPFLFQGASEVTPYTANLASSTYTVEVPASYTFPDVGSMQLSSCDDLTGWANDDALSMTTGTGIEGTGAVYVECENAWWTGVLFAPPTRPMDMLHYDEMIVALGSDAAVAGMTVYIQTDWSNWYRWDISVNTVLQDYTLDLSNPTASAGSPNLNSVDLLAFRRSTPNATFTIDNIRLVSTATGETVYFMGWEGEQSISPVRSVPLSSDRTLTAQYETTANIYPTFDSQAELDNDVLRVAWNPHVYERYVTDAGIPNIDTISFVNETLTLIISGNGPQDIPIYCGSRGPPVSVTDGTLGFYDAESSIQIVSVSLSTITLELSWLTEDPPTPPPTSGSSGGYTPPPDLEEGVDTPFVTAKSMWDLFDLPEFRWPQIDFGDIATKIVRFFDQFLDPLRWLRNKLGV